MHPSLAAIPWYCNTPHIHLSTVTYTLNEPTSNCRYSTSGRFVACKSAGAGTDSSSHLSRSVLEQVHAQILWSVAVSNPVGVHLEMLQQFGFFDAAGEHVNEFARQVWLTVHFDSCEPTIRQVLSRAESNGYESVFTK